MEEFLLLQPLPAVVAAISTDTGRFYAQALRLGSLPIVVSFGSAIGGLRYELAIPLARMKSKRFHPLSAVSLVCDLRGLIFVIILITRSQLQAIDGMRNWGLVAVSALVVGLTGLGQATLIGSSE